MLLLIFSSFLAFEFELEASTNLGQLRQEIGNWDRSDPEDIRLFHHSEILRELIRMKENRSDNSIFSTENQVIEFSDNELLAAVFGEVGIINVDFETLVYTQIDVKCIGTDRKFLVNLNLNDSPFTEVEADDIKHIFVCSSIPNFVSN